MGSPCFEFQASGSEFQVSGSRFWVRGFSFQVPGFGFGVSGFGFQVSGSEFQVSGCGFRVSERDPGYAPCPRVLVRGGMTASFQASGSRFRVPGSRFRVSRIAVFTVPEGAGAGWYDRPSCPSMNRPCERVWGLRV